MSNNTTILTPNRRLAAFLRHQFDQQQQQAGHNVWQSLDVLPIDSWFSRLHETCFTAPLLLNPQQELEVWQQIISNSETGQQLLSIRPTAQLAQQAWQFVQQWQVPLDTLKQPEHQDVFAFYQWALSFCQQCEQQNWLDHARLPNWLSEQNLSLPKIIELYGFEEIPPQLQAFFQQTNIQTKQRSATTLNSDTLCMPCANSDDEIQQMAQFAKQHYQQDPQARIGCVILDLQQQRDKIQQVFTETFSPQTAITADSHQSMPFDISAGTPLAECPLVYSALQILNLANKNIPLEIISHLLRTPFLAYSEKEMGSRAYLDLQLHRLGEHHLSLRQCLASAAYYQCTALHKQLTNLKPLLRQKPQSCSEWASLFARQLKVMGWPGERSLSSIEYQQLQKWLSDQHNKNRVLGNPTFKFFTKIITLSHSNSQAGGIIRGAKGLPRLAVNPDIAKARFLRCR